MSRYMMIEFIAEVGLVPHTYFIFYDSHVMSEEDARKECHFFDGGCADIKNLGHFLILDEKHAGFLKELVHYEKDKAYDMGYEAGQTNMLEAGYILPTED